MSDLPDKPKRFTQPEYNSYLLRNLNDLKRMVEDLKKANKTLESEVKELKKTAALIKGVQKSLTINTDGIAKLKESQRTQADSIDRLVYTLRKK